MDNFSNQLKDFHHLFIATNQLNTMETNNLDISSDNIVQAFKVLYNPISSPANISAANEYLNSCERYSKFPLVLIQLYSTSSEPFVQLQSILLLLNIIKRNWQIRRGRGKLEEIQSLENQKEQIRKQLLRIYPLYNLIYIKHINQTLKFLARQDYPQKYIELQQFMLSSLRTLYEQVLTSQQKLKHQNYLIIGFLSTVKIVTKQYASKRLSHSEIVFNEYISELIKISFPISEKCHQLIFKMWSSQNFDLQIFETLVESAKKIDKIVLYCLQCMPNSLQYVAQVQNMFQTILNSISIIDSYILSGIQNLQQLSKCLQSYISGVLEQVFKVQSMYPFLLIDVLENYIHMILKMLVDTIPKKIYRNERLILTIVQANLKIFTCFTYYMPSEEFQSSIYNRKSTHNLEMQQKMHAQYLNVFTPDNVAQLLSKLITEVMISWSINSQQKDVVDQEMVLQQTETGSYDTLTESNAYQLSILLCKNIIKCFKKQLKPVLESLFTSVGKLQIENNALKKKIIENTMEIILILPKIYEQQQLPLEHVLNLLQVLYSNHQYSMLARLIKNYHEVLNHSTLQNSFAILSQIVATPANSQYMTVDIIYQSALTMKKMLSQPQFEIFSFELFSDCIINLFRMLQDKKFTNTPTLMWPLIKLANQLLKLTNTSILIGATGQKIMDCIEPFTLAKTGQELTVCGIAESIQELLNIICGQFRNSYFSEEPITPIVTKSTLKILYISYSLIINNIRNRKMQNVDSIYVLWLCLIRSYPTIQQQQTFNLSVIPQMKILNVNMSQLFAHLFETVLEQDSVCAIQILQEYLICGLITMNESQILSIFEKLLINCLQQHKVRTYTALFSMYYCYLIVQIESGFLSCLQQDILKLLIETLVKYVNQISPQINGLRTLLMIIINYCILKFGVQNIYQAFNSFFQNQYTKWFMAYCWSGQYVSNKLCHKINSAAYLKALQELGPATFGKMLQTPIQQNYPLDNVLKTMIICLQPTKISQGWVTFSNMYKLMLPTESTGSSIGSSTSRKIRLQLSGFIKQILISDQRQNYQKLMTELFTFWDWGEDDIRERFDKITSSEIISLIKGTFKNQYDINQPD